MTAAPTTSRKWPVQGTLLASFGLALLILIAIVVVSYQVTLSVGAAADLRAHSDLVRLNLQALLSQMQDAETGQRGFILTGDQSYLAPYDTAVNSVSGEISALRSLTAD